MNRLEMDGIYDFARRRGWSIQTVEYGMASIARFQLGEKASRPDVAALLEFWHPAGCIVDCAGRSPLFVKSEFAGLPTVFLDRHPSTIHHSAVCISSNVESIAQCAARELLSLGFVHYAYLPWIEETVWSRERGDRFGRMVKMNGKIFHSFTSVKDAADMLSVQREIGAWAQSLPKPCGIFVANDFMAERIIAACSSAGILVPEQVAVVGVDDEEQLCENADVTISSVRPDYVRAGFRACELLEELIKNPRRALTSETFGALHLTRRASTRLIRSSDARVLKAIDFIRRHACEGLTPPEVVEAMGCSRRLADLRFREVTGHTILDEIHEVRLSRVKELLARPLQNVSAIPGLCGYASLVDLRRVFRQRIGMTMREWQEETVA